MKLTTSSMITGNSLIVPRIWSEIGTSLSLVSWPESAWMLFARLFMASWDSSCAFNCCQNHQWCNLHRKQKRGQPCIQPGYKKTQFARWDSSASSQTTYRNTSQQSITLLAAIPKSVPILIASLVEEKRCRTDCNSFNSRTIFLICGSSVSRWMGWLYNYILKRKQHSSNIDSIPQWPATAAILGSDYQTQLWILLMSCE